MYFSKSLILVYRTCTHEVNKNRRLFNSFNNETEKGGLPLRENICSMVKIIYDSVEIFITLSWVVISLHKFLCLIHLDF